MLVVYQGDGEVLVCAKKNEKKMIKQWFNDGNRDIDVYNREINEVVQIESRSPIVDLHQVKV